MLLDGTMLLPEYSPPLYIFPDENSPTEFHFWTLQLLSMTLLEPVEGVSCLDYERSVPAQWAANRIVMPPPDGATMPGLRVIFDTCEYRLRKLRRGAQVAILWLTKPRWDQVPRPRLSRHRCSARFGKTGSNNQQKNTRVTET